MKVQPNHKFSHIVDLTLVALFAFTIAVKGQLSHDSGHESVMTTKQSTPFGPGKKVSSQAPTLTAFQGITYTGTEGIPPDPVLAAGPSNVLAVVNTYYMVFTKAGSVVYQGDLHSFFNDPSDKLYDPKVVFDQYSQRWVVLILADDGQTGYYLLGVSESADPNPSSWYKYKLNASIDGSQSTGLRADFSGLGYDANCVYITSNQYPFASGPFQYSKIRILNKSQIYSGQTPTSPFTDFVNMKDADGSTSFTVKPVQQFGSPNAFYLVDAKMNGGSAITLWEISNPSSNPQLTLQATIPVKTYGPPPDAAQLGTTDELSTDYGGSSQNDVYTQDAMYRDGYVYTSFSTSHNWGSGTVSAIQYEKIDVNSNTAVIDDIYGSDGVYYFYASVYADAYGDIALVFCESSNNEYPGMYWAYRTPWDAAASAPQVLRAGDGYYTYGELGAQRYGDYSGICLDVANDNQIWMCGEWGTSSHNWDTEIGTFQFPIVKFSNYVNGSDAGGTLQVNSQMTIPSGTSLSFDLDSGNSELTLSQGGSDQDRFVNTNGVVLAKHNNWDNTASWYLLSNTFTVTGVPSETETAYFLPLNGATVTASSVDGASLSGMSLQFNDPWYLLNSGGQQGNNFATAPIPITQNGQTGSPMTGAYNQASGGVFLNQGVTNGQWTFPYYSVGLPSQSISLGGYSHPLNVTSWSATGATLGNPNSPQTPVDFTSSNATVTAKVKCQLASSNNSATAYSGQRKLAVDANGYHLVYESAGDIWYTASTDGGATWSPDTMISAGNGTAHNPSISQPSSTTAALYVFWVDRASSPNSGYSVYAKEYYHTYQQNQWYPSIEVGGVDEFLYLGYSKKYAKPCGVAMYDTGIKFLVAFEDTTQGVDIIDNNGSFYGIPSAPTSAKDPSMFCNSPVSSKLYIAYDNGQDVYFSSSPTGGTPSFGTPTLLSNSSYASPNINPSVSVDGAGRVQFAWQGFDHSLYYMNAVFQRTMWTSGYLQPINEFVSYFATDEPSICGHTDANGGATLMVHDASNAIYRVTSTDGTTWYQGGNYPGVYLTSNCSYPNLVCRADPSSVPYILTRTNTTPFAISVGVRNENDGTGTVFYKGTTNETGGAIFGQALQILDTTKGLNAVLTLSNIKVLTSDNGSFPAVMLTVDSVAFKALQSGHSIISSAAFDAALKVDSCAAQVSVTVALLDPKSNSSLMTLAVSSASPSTQGTTSLFSANIPSAILATTPRLGVIVDGKVDTLAELNLINTFCLYDSSSSSGNPAQPATAQLPTSYNLSQNYPDPFNPSTTINYSLPISSQVVLKVYDVLGREVRTIVDGYQAAGDYSAVFDASGLPSGVYFYRISAGKFTSVKKLVVVK